MIASQSVPRFGAGVTFRFDAVRSAWVLLAPERLFLPDAHATEILGLVDGARTVDAIAATLAARFDAPADMIAADVLALLQDLADKGAIRQ